MCVLVYVVYHNDICSDKRKPPSIGKSRHWRLIMPHACTNRSFRWRNSGVVSSVVAAGPGGQRDNNGHSALLFARVRSPGIRASLSIGCLSSMGSRIPGGTRHVNSITFHHRNILTYTYCCLSNRTVDILHMVYMVYPNPNNRHYISEPNTKLHGILAALVLVLLAHGQHGIVRVCVRMSMAGLRAIGCVWAGTQGPPGVSRWVAIICTSWLQVIRGNACVWMRMKLCWKT